MNLGVECDIRVKMVEKDMSRGIYVRCDTLLKTCSLWALSNMTATHVKCGVTEIYI